MILGAGPKQKRRRMEKFNSHALLPGVLGEGSASAVECRPCLHRGQSGRRDRGSAANRAGATGSRECLDCSSSRVVPPSPPPTVPLRPKPEPARAPRSTTCPPPITHAQADDCQPTATSLLERLCNPGYAHAPCKRRPSQLWRRPDAAVIASAASTSPFTAAAAATAMTAKATAATTDNRRTQSGPRGVLAARKATAPGRVLDRPPPARPLMCDDSSTHAFSRHACHTNHIAAGLPACCCCCSLARHPSPFFSLTRPRRHPPCCPSHPRITLLLLLPPPPPLLLLLLRRLLIPS